LRVPAPLSVRTYTISLSKVEPLPVPMVTMAWPPASAMPALFTDIEGLGGRSSSRMLASAKRSLSDGPSPTVTPVAPGASRFTRMISAGSSILSLAMGTETVVEVCPAAMVTVPLETVKSSGSMRF
jgi:hypothetical protein